MHEFEWTLKSLRKRIVLTSSIAGEGHIPTSFSILEILYSYYLSQKQAYGLLVQSPDHFILSKGHAAIGLYAVLEYFELIPSHWLEDFCKFDSPLGGHPDMKKVPFVEASTGSLGHGLPIGVGVSLGKKIQGKPGMTYVLVGDGELNEGSNWESLMVASHHKLSNLTVIVDWNGSTERALSLGNLSYKFKSFDVSVHEIDGHSVFDLCKYFESPSEFHSSGPRVLLAKTTKGKGVKLMESSPNEWHHKIPSAEELDQILQEIE
jgi:transketolase